MTKRATVGSLANILNASKIQSACVASPSNIKKKCLRRVKLQEVSFLINGDESWEENGKLRILMWISYPRGTDYVQCADKCP